MKLIKIIWDALVEIIFQVKLYHLVIRKLFPYNYWTEEEISNARKEAKELRKLFHE